MSPTYDDIMRRALGQPQNVKVSDPDQLPGLKVRFQVKCPSCNDMIPMIYVVQRIDGIMLTPEYGKKGEVKFKR